MKKEHMFAAGCITLIVCCGLIAFGMRPPRYSAVHSMGIGTVVLDVYTGDVSLSFASEDH